MKIFTPWLRSFLPPLPVADAQLAEDLTLRGIAVEGVTEYSDAAGDSDGAVFEMDITTNRVDAMNHFGVAREVAAMYDLPLHRLDAALPPAAEAAGCPVRIEDEAGCGRFTARIIRGVKVRPAEGRMAEWFTALGIKRISDAVDVTNFALLGMGHPTHAFDLRKVQGAIVVRRAHAGEPLRLLDGTTRTLVAEDLVVADEQKALGLAGVMGGWDSMITAETTDVLVESAWFSPATVRASSRRHGIHTDASHRFERGADFLAAPVASALVCRGILDQCGGHLEGPLVDVAVPAWAARTAGRAPVRLRLREVWRLLGTTLSPDGITAGLVERYLGALGCRLTPSGEGAWEVALPSWRLDLEREIDLIEEIARVYGYNRFANTLPVPAAVAAHPAAAGERAVRRLLPALGFTEALSSTFSSAEESQTFAPGVAAVGLENPLNDEASNLRPSLLPGMVAMLALNGNRDVLSARLFEVGTVFSGSGEGPAAGVTEMTSLALGMSVPPEREQQGYAAPEDRPFYELKGVLESVLALFAVGEPAWTQEGVPAAMERGRAAAVLAGGRPVGAVGQLTASELSRRKLRQPVWLAELDLAWLLGHSLRQAVAGEISRFQAVERDFSFTFPDTVTWAQVEGAVRGVLVGSRARELRRVEPVELWRDSKKYPGVYSLLVRTVLQSMAGTLTEEELTGWSAGVIGALTALGGTLRSQPGAEAV